MKLTYPDLPILEKKEEIIALLKAHQVIVVAGETGSGKTTQLPKICLEAGLIQKGIIGHTQPRRIAARTVASRIATELQTELGNEVGYKVRFSDKTDPRTVIKLMTDGILLSEMQQNKLLSQYDCIIIDEAHERSLNIDFLLGFLKRLIKKRSDLKIIVTSATIDVEKFSKFFHDAPIVEIAGRTYPVTVKYASSEIDKAKIDPALEIVKIIQEIKQHGPGDILIFQSGEKEIRDLIEVLAENIKEVDLLPLFARLSVREQQKIFAPSKYRKIIVSTNVAETSLTVPNVRYVIDSGVVRLSRYQYRSKLQRLPIEPISQASANQRKGRCGRVGPGICYRLYTEDDYQNRPLFTDPEILRTNLAGVILKMLSLGIKNVHSFPFLDAPDSRYIKDGFALLQRLSAVDNHYFLTPIGKTLANIPIEPRLARILLAANQMGALKEVLVIVSALSIPDPRERPLEMQEKADQRHQKFQDERSDFMTFLKLWQFVREQRKKLSHQRFRKLCFDNFLSFIRICEWFDIYTQLLEVCKELGFRLNHIAADYATIHKALLTGCIDKIGLKEEKSEYLGARHLRFFLHPGSNLIKKPPLWVMSYEIVHTKRVYARTNAQVEPLWIAEIGEPFLKKQLFEPHLSLKTGHVVALEQSMLFGLIVAKRKVNYDKFFPDKAREILIQEGLVEEALALEADFFQQNQATKTKLAKLEERFRHRFLLLDNMRIYQFYEQVLPFNITSKTHLLHFIKEHGEEVLIFKEEEIIATRLPEGIFEEFPESLLCGKHTLALQYCHDLSSEDDGVTVLLPVSLLGMAQDHDFSWLVPGLLAEKIAAYLRALPKMMRSKMFPFAHFVDKVKTILDPKTGTFEKAMQNALKDLVGLEIPANYWDKITLPSYLSLHFQVLAKNGQILAKGNDLVALYEDLKLERPELFMVSHALKAENKVQWDFGSLPESCTVKKNSAMHLMYPALVDKKESVAVELFARPFEASRAHEKGLARLYLLQLSDKIKFAKRSITPLQKKNMTKNYHVETFETLLDDILMHCALFLFVENQVDVREEAQFTKQLLAKRGEFLLVFKKVLLLAEDALQKQEAIKQKVLALKKWPTLHPVLEDITGQLEALFAVHFLKTTPHKWLNRYPVYLKAILLRLEKLPGQLEKDKVLLKDIKAVWQAYLKKSQSKTDLLRDKTSPLFDFPWKMEELRVSFFAQELRTLEPVSKMRLLKLLQTS